MHRKKILAAILAASFLLTSCSLFDQGSSRRTRSGRNSDDDDDHNGFTRPMQETVETEETEALTGITPFDIYTNILADYASQIEEYEDGYRSYTIPSINYMDITGDRMEELIFKYVSEPYHVHLAIYTIDSNSCTAYMLFDDEIEDDLGSWGLSRDAVVLDNGNLILSNFLGSGGEYYQQIEEYQLVDNSYVLINEWELQERIADDDHGENGYTVIAGEATLNGEPTTSDYFYECQADYINRIAAPVMPYSSRPYYPDYTVRDIYDRDFNSIPGSVFAQGNYMYLSSFGQPIVTVQPTWDSYAECYLALLDEYEEDANIIENSGSQSFPTVALRDITDDGVPELFITYASGDAYDSPDSYSSASLDIYTYDEESGTYVQLLDYSSSVIWAGSGLFTDIILLDGGRLLFVREVGSLEGMTWEATEYSYYGSELVSINFFGYQTEIIDWDTEEYEWHYYILGEETSEEFFNQNYYGYMSLGICALTSCPWYSDEYDNGDWGNYMLSLPHDNVYHYDEAIDYLNNQ